MLQLLEILFSAIIPIDFSPTDIHVKEGPGDVLIFMTGKVSISKLATVYALICNFEEHYVVFDTTERP